VFESFLEKSQENGPLAENLQDRKGKRTSQKNKRGDRKGEPNDSPEISDRGWHHTSPASLRGCNCTNNHRLFLLT